LGMDDGDGQVEGQHLSRQDLGDGPSRWTGLKKPCEQCISRICATVLDTDTQGN